MKEQIKIDKSTIICILFFFAIIAAAYYTFNSIGQITGNFVYYINH